MHLIPPNDDARQDLVFSAMPASQLAAKYQHFTSVTPYLSARLFLDQLGRSAPPNDPWATIRAVEGLDHALRYTVASRGKLRVYWIQSAPPASQYVYLVAEGEPKIYRLSGALTAELYTAILSGLQLAPAP